jgi:hypothetical protein
MQNKVRVDLHSYDSEIVMLQDYSAKKTTIIYPANSTYPQGVCQVRTHPVATGASSTDPMIHCHSVLNLAGQSVVVHL